MHRKYNIYDMMLRAAAGDPPSGAAGDPSDDGEGGASASANAKTINAGDDDPPAPAAGDPPAGEGDPPAAAGDGDPPADDKPKPAMVPRDPIIKRVGELTRDKKALSDENTRLKAALAAKAAPAAGDPPAGDDAAPDRSAFKTQAEFDEAVRVEAARVAQETRTAEEFNNRCNTVADTGEKEYKDWADSVGNLRMLGDDGNIPKTLLDAALEAEDPAKALHHLGQNPDEAMRIMKLPLLKQAAEVFKHGTKVAKVPPKRSGAPPPLEPVGGAGGIDENAGLGDDVSDEEWLRNRNAQIKQNVLVAGSGGTSR